MKIMQKKHLLVLSHLLFFVLGIAFGLFFLSSGFLQYYSQSEENHRIAGTTPVDGWDDFVDSYFNYQVQYPDGWQFDSSEGGAHKARFFKGGNDSDNIQIVNIADINSDHKDESANNRGDTLKMLTNGSKEKISIAGGEGYYSIDKTSLYNITGFYDQWLHKE